MSNDIYREFINHALWTNLVRELLMTKKALLEFSQALAVQYQLYNGAPLILDLPYLESLCSNDTPLFCGIYYQMHDEGALCPKPP